MSLFPDIIDPIGEAKKILSDAVAAHRPRRVFSLFSGGHDSLCATHVSRTLPFDGVAHVNTGIGIEETREYVRGTCSKFGWPLTELSPEATFEGIVLEYGFPGPGQHGRIYSQLKERCLRRLINANAPNRCRVCNRKRKGHGWPGASKRAKRNHHYFDPHAVMFITGVRRQESKKRMGYVEPINRVGRVVWVAPLVNWSSEDKNDYIDKYRLPKNRVVQRLCMSGECLCGAFANKGEIGEIACWYPDVAARIRSLEARAKEAGVHCVWGTPPAQPEPEIETPLYGLCWSCEAKGEPSEPLPI